MDDGGVVGTVFDRDKARFYHGVDFHNGGVVVGVDLDDVRVFNNDLWSEVAEFINLVCECIPFFPTGKHADGISPTELVAVDLDLVATAAFVGKGVIAQRATCAAGGISGQVAVFNAGNDGLGNRDLVHGIFRE